MILHEVFLKDKSLTKRSLIYSLDHKKSTYQTLNKDRINILKSY